MVWLGLLLEYELTLRRQKQFETRARVAKLRHPASIEDVKSERSIRMTLSLAFMSPVLRKPRWRVVFRAGSASSA